MMSLQEYDYQKQSWIGINKKWGRSQKLTSHDWANTSARDPRSVRELVRFFNFSRLGPSPKIFRFLYQGVLDP